MAAREEMPLLVRVEIDRVVDEVGSDAAEVQQCVALRRGAVTGDRQALALEPDQE